MAAGAAASAALRVVSSARMFGGVVRKYAHDSAACGCEMKFSAYLPPAVADDGATAKAPVLYWLSGLTCTEDNFIQKAGAQRVAAELGVVLICPDTSPRGTNYDGEHDAYDFGSGAGFYVNATKAPYSATYKMYDYVVTELPALVATQLPVDASRQSIFGHSMGGHGALTIALKNAGKYRSVSAFAPICNPINCPWGKKAFAGYLGDDEAEWKQYDATELAAAYSGDAIDVLIDQGGADDFLEKKQLLPEAFKAATDSNDLISVDLRMRDGYDHSYFFIATFVEEHLRFHHKHLTK